MGEVGFVSPLIDAITSQGNGQQDHYAPGTLNVFNGDNRRLNEGNRLQGIFVYTLLARGDRREGIVHDDGGREIQVTTRTTC